MLGRLQLLRSWRSRVQRITGKRKRCERRQKRGKHDGVLERLKANARRPPIPSLFLANVRSLDNKLDLLRIRMSVSEEMRNCSILCLTETWLKDNMPNSAFQIYGWQLFRADRNMLSGKARGGGLCVYINKGWCMNCVVINSHCSEDVELMTVKCCPFYSPRQFLLMFVIAAYIAPHANANNVLKELHNNISSLQNKHPEAFYVVARDFNHVNLTDILPRFHQHVTIPTRGNNMLDRVYTNMRDTYRAVPRPHLGLSDHICIMLVPAYHPPLQHSKPTQKTVWPNDGDSELQDCFECAAWQVFRDAAVFKDKLEDYTSAVLGYISKCAEDVTTTESVMCYPNQKPCLNAGVCVLLKARDAAFRSGDAQRLRRARRELTAGVKRAKKKKKKREPKPHTHGRFRVIFLPSTHAVCGGVSSASLTTKPGMHNAPGTLLCLRVSNGSTPALRTLTHTNMANVIGCAFQGALFNFSSGKPALQGPARRRGGWQHKGRTWI
ncbi:unnamed protein product [Oreochromis niloticus]|nr:unnamed protein product [Mustela putorius furo]